jgi:hypothetical protein
MKLFAAFVLVAAAALIAAPAPVQANPEFAGEWVLDPQRSSDLGRLKAANRTVVLEGKNLRINSTADWGQGDPESFEYTYITDGVEHHVVGPPRWKRDVTAVWKGFFGQKLEVTWTMDFDGNSVYFTELWEKKSRGLRMTNKMKTPVRNFEQKLYFVRPGEQKK